MCMCVCIKHRRFLRMRSSRFISTLWKRKKTILFLAPSGFIRQSERNGKSIFGIDCFFPTCLSISRNTFPQRKRKKSKPISFLCKNNIFDFICKKNELFFWKLLHFLFACDIITITNIKRRRPNEQNSIVKRAGLYLRS